VRGINIINQNLTKQHQHYWCKYLYGFWWDFELWLVSL